MSEHDERADRLEGEANLLEEEGEQVAERVEDAKADVESKVEDAGIPGAQPSPEEMGDEVAADEREAAENRESTDAGDGENEVGGV